MFGAGFNIIHGIGLASGLLIEKNIKGAGGAAILPDFCRLIASNEFRLTKGLDNAAAGKSL